MDAIVLAGGFGIRLSHIQGCTKTDDPGGGKAVLDAIIITTSKLVV